MHDVEWTAERVRRFWDFYSSNEAVEDAYFARKVGRHLIDYVSQRIDIGTAVDLGCGRGDLIGYLLSGHDAYGADQSPESVALVNDRFRGHPRFKGAFAPSGLPGEIANTVFILEVIEHVDDDALGALLTEAQRLLKPGGHLVVTTPNNEDLALSKIMCPDCECVFHTMQHVRSWSAETLSRTLERAGFKGQAATTFLSDKTGLKRPAHRLFQRLLNRPEPNLIYIGS